MEFAEVEINIRKNVAWEDLSNIVKQVIPNLTKVFLF